MPVDPATFASLIEWRQQAVAEGRLRRLDATFGYASSHPGPPQFFRGELEPRGYAGIGEFLVGTLTDLESEQRLAVSIFVSYPLRGNIAGRVPRRGSPAVPAAVPQQEAYLSARVLPDSDIAAASSGQMFQWDLTEKLLSISMFGTDIYALCSLVIVKQEDIDAVAQATLALAESFRKLTAGKRKQPGLGKAAKAVAGASRR